MKKNYDKKLNGEALRKLEPLIKRNRKKLLQEIFSPASCFVFSLIVIGMLYADYVGNDKLILLIMFIGPIVGGTLLEVMRTLSEIRACKDGLCQDCHNE